ncbi:MAG TPA: hypothetical protein VGE74_27875 [Gemmata sp.]
MPPARPLAAIALTASVFAAALAFQKTDPAPLAQPAPEPSPLTTAAPKFWKGNLHTHTLWSDGDDFPDMVVDWYKRHGYQFLALTEHNVIAEGDKWVDAETNATRKAAVAKYKKRFGEKWVETRTAKDKAQVKLKPFAEFRSLFEEPGKFLLVPAEEITHGFAKRPVHINGINVRDPIKPLNGKDVIETVRVNLRQVNEQRTKTSRVMIAFLNHPNFQWGVRAEEMLLADELRFFEVFNGHPGVRNYGDPDHASCERIWDITLALRLGKHKLPIVYGLATDDSHGYHEYGAGKVNPGRGWVMVRAPFLTAEAAVKGLEAGDFYASTGVVLDDITRTDKELKIAIKGEAGVTYKTEFVATTKDADLTATPKVFTDKAGKETPVTGAYSPDIGKVVATSDDLNPTYTFTGKELYVRARITSTKPHPNPYAKGDVEVAWTQPMVP